MAAALASNGDIKVADFPSPCKQAQAAPLATAMLLAALALLDPPVGHSMNTWAGLLLFIICSNAAVSSLVLLHSSSETFNFPDLSVCIV